MAALSEYETFELLREKLSEARDAAVKLTRIAPGPERLGQRQFFRLRMREAAELCRAAGQLRSQVSWLENARRFQRMEDVARDEVIIPWGRVATAVEGLLKTVGQLANQRVH